MRGAPGQATLVPERREEVTTEGGLDVVTHRRVVADAVRRLHDAGIVVSLFLDPDERQIATAAELGVEAVELHTGQYALARGSQVAEELSKLAIAGRQICQAGMALHAGHGLNYHNVRAGGGAGPHARTEYRPQHHRAGADDRHAECRARNEGAVDPAGEQAAR